MIEVKVLKHQLICPECGSRESGSFHHVGDICGNASGSGYMSSLCNSHHSCDGKMELMRTFDCWYCENGGSIRVVSGRVIQSHKKDFWANRYFACYGCRAYVGCYSDGSPKGQVANTALRIERERFLESLNPYLVDFYAANFYRSLSELLQIPFDQCHVGLLDLGTLRKAIELLPEIESQLREDHY